MLTFVEELRHVPIPQKYEATLGKEETAFKATQRGAGKKGVGMMQQWRMIFKNKSKKEDCKNKQLGGMMRVQKSGD